MKIKVCGLTDTAQISQLADSGVDYAGLIFYPKSPRYCVGRIRHQDLAGLSGRIELTGVFVDEEIDDIIEKIGEYHLKAVQLCGRETPEQCSELRRNVKVIKVVHVADALDHALMHDLEAYCDFLLFDTPSAGYGGSGKKFDWNSIHTTAPGRHFFLSGGIGEDDVAAIRAFRHPAFYGIDVNSRFEIQPGVKNISKIKSFITQLKDNEIPGR